MSVRVVAIGQARLGSTRLPAKIMLFLQGMTILELFVRRVRRARRVDEVVIATSEETRDEVIVNECRRLGVNCFRGSEQNVLKRYADCAVRFKADHVVRVTSDCPLIDPELLDAGIVSHLQSGADFSSNNLVPSFAHGVDFQIIRMPALLAAEAEARAPRDREHVVPYLEQHPERFPVNRIEATESRAGIRFTLDTIEDYELLCRMADRCPALETATYPDLLALADALHREAGRNGRARWAR